MKKSAFTRGYKTVLIGKKEIGELWNKIPVGSGPEFVQSMHRMPVKEIYRKVPVTCAVGPVAFEGRLYCVIIKVERDFLRNPMFDPMYSYSFNGRELREESVPIAVKNFLNGVNFSCRIMPVSQTRLILTDDRYVFNVNMVRIDRAHRNIDHLKSLRACRVKLIDDEIAAAGVQSNYIRKTELRIRKAAFRRGMFRLRETGLIDELDV